MSNKKRLEVTTEGEDVTKEKTPLDKCEEGNGEAGEGLLSCNLQSGDTSEALKTINDKIKGEGYSTCEEERLSSKGGGSTLTCMICGKQSTEAVSCEKCSCGCYCSSECKDKHENHSTYCSIICDLEKHETEKRMAAEIFSVDAEKLPYKMKLNLIRLVGERPVVNIFLDNKRVNGLWDTGAMVSVINEQFLGESFPEVEVRSIEEFIGNREFNVTVANQGSLNIKGIAVLKFGVSEEQVLFEVPFLVTGDQLANTIIGYNTIEYLASNFQDQLNLMDALPKVIESLSQENVESMVNLLQKSSEIREISREAKLSKSTVVYPGSVEKVRCKIKDLEVNNIHNKVILFEALEELCVESELVVFDSPHVLKNRKKYIDVCVYNPTAENIVISKGTVLGQVSDIAAAYTLPVLPSKSAEINEIE